MTDIIGEGERVDVVYLCPTCGSPSLKLPYLLSTVAECKACSWSGAQDKLVAMPVKHDGGSAETIIARFLSELRLLLVKNFATPFGRLLLKWGFLTPQSLNKQTLGRYLTAVTVAIVRAVIEEREKIEKEMVNGD